MTNQLPRKHSEKELCGLDWIRGKSWPSAQEHEKSLSVVDLFCGCGGFTLGVWEAARVHRRKLRIQLAVDVFSDALSVYRENFEVNGEIARQVDISTILSGIPGNPPNQNEKAIQAQVGKVDFIMAGPPCQGHSDLNNSTRRNDPRNELYLKVVRAIISPLTRSHL